MTNALFLPRNFVALLALADRKRAVRDILPDHRSGASVGAIADLERSLDAAVQTKNDYVRAFALALVGALTSCRPSVAFAAWACAAIT